MTAKRKCDIQLLAACYDGDVKAARRLLSEGADPNAKDRAGRTALHNAVTAQSRALVALLIQRGAGVSVADRDGVTPLHGAAKLCNAGIAELLLAHAADLEARDSYGNTPAFHAVFQSDDGGALLQLLLKHGANMRRKNFHGVSPLSLAKSIRGFDMSWVRLRHVSGATASARSGKKPGSVKPKPPGAMAKVSNSLTKRAEASALRVKKPPRGR